MPQTTTRALKPRNTRPKVLVGRHHGVGGSSQVLLERGRSSSSGSGISRGMPGRLRREGRETCCTRRKRESADASSFVSSRLSKVVRIARFHYRADWKGFFRRQKKGNPRCYGAKDRGHKTGLRERLSTAQMNELRSSNRRAFPLADCIGQIVHLNAWASLACNHAENIVREHSRHFLTEAIRSFDRSRGLL